MQNNPTPTQTTSTSSDEIDLRELFSAIGRFFGRIGRGIINIILSIRRASRRFWLLILTCMTIGALLGYLTFIAFRPYYASELKIGSQYYKLNTLTTLIEGLNKLALEENYDVLAKRLNISLDEARNIRTFEVSSEVNPEDMLRVESLMLQIESNNKLQEEQLEEIRTLLTNGTDRFTIHVSFYELGSIDALERGLIYYLSNNDFIKRRVEIEQQNLQSLRQKLMEDQEQLQELKRLQAETIGRMIETSRSGSNNVIFGSPDGTSDPLNAFKESIVLYEQLLETNRQLELNRSVEVVNGFTPFEKPASVPLLGKLVYGALIGLGAAYLLILLIGINKALNRYEAKQLAK